MFPSELVAERKILEPLESSPLVKRPLSLEALPEHRERVLEKLRG